MQHSYAPFPSRSAIQGLSFLRGPLILVVWESRLQSTFYLLRIMRSRFEDLFATPIFTRNITLLTSCLSWIH
jgi:hypothetical protein